MGTWHWKYKIKTAMRGLGFYNGRSKFLVFNDLHKPYKNSFLTDYIIILWSVKMKLKLN